MGASKRRRSDRAGRLPMPSPGRPLVGRREYRQRFWEAIARGLSSEESGVVAVKSRPTRSGDRSPASSGIVVWGFFPRTTPRRTASRFARVCNRSGLRHRI